jgi:hypothetical protein
VDWRTRLGGFGNARLHIENLLLASNAMRLVIDNIIDFSADSAAGDVLALRQALGRLLQPLLAGVTASACTKLATRRLQLTAIVHRLSKVT